MVDSTTSLCKLSMTFIDLILEISVENITGSMHRHVMGMNTNKLTSLRPLYMGIIENVAPQRST